MSTKDKVIKAIAGDIHGSNISSEDLKEALRESNMNMAKVLSMLAKKIDNDKYPDNKKKNEDVEEETEDNIATKKALYGKNFNQAGINKYGRFTQLPRGGNSKMVNRERQRLRKIDELNRKMADKEMNQPLQADEIFVLTKDPQENYMQEIQNSIGNHNEYSKKLRVLKGFKKNMQPSLELRSVPI